MTDAKATDPLTRSMATGDEDFSIGGFADDVAAVVDRLPFPRFFLVGHSLGASVASCFAGRYPDRLQGLILVDFGGDPRDDGPAELAWLMDGLAPANFETFAEQAMKTCLRGARTGVADRVLAGLKATPRNSFSGAVLGLMDFDPVASLAHGPDRKLHLYSSFLDTMGLVPIHQRVHGMEAEQIPDCSHWVHLDGPELFNQSLQQWLNPASPHPPFQPPPEG
ncbi:alpha/beta fold hydrolase [Mesoterricola silvestris]|uniref:AB hydrolase-1 domain-containing protein n=1 Tax=Mesoterricola silvestris TaxID=2927979 RepID=A0AA48GLG7_9BACT|nr:alpha/beta hydrolase [Mesoterricola silvestris]BDU73572.1 hypothetical protein METEAL_27460 [Mesoterricola silvestris]